MTDRLRIANGLDADQLYAHVREASRGDRYAGSADEARVYDYLANVLSELGFDVQRESPTNLIGLTGAASVDVVSPTPMSLRAYGYAMSPPTPEGGVEGLLYDVGNGVDADYPAGRLDGRVLLSTGIAMPAKTLPADRSGALAQIHVGGERHHEMCISTVWGSPTPETFGLLPKTPSIAITAPDGAKLRAMLVEGPVRVRVRATSCREWRPIPLLTASLPGVESDLYTLFSGHVDSWQTGAMDNASGNAVQLGIAELLAAHRSELRRGIRLAFWSGHSHGRYAGSTWYADHHWQDLYDRCACYVNVDSVGGAGADDLSDGPTMAETYAFTAAIVKEITGHTLGYRRVPRSSEESFLGVGISAALSTLSEQASSGATVEAARALLGNRGKRGGGFGWWWHTTEDTLDKVDPARLRRDAQVYAALIWDLCTLPALPFDFGATAHEIATHLAQLQDAAGVAFDLSGPMGTAQRLERALQRLAQANPDPAVANALSIALARTLIPATFTKSGPFEQDAALGLSPLPGLVPVRELAALPAGSDARHCLEVKLVRERNRLGAALSSALRSVERANGGAEL